MRLKSYFAGTVEAAMALAREELGPDAMLVQSKRTAAEAKKSGRYEVVFALAETELTSAADSTPRTGSSSFGQVFASEQGDGAIRKLFTELDVLKRRIESMSGNMTAAAPAMRYGADTDRSRAFVRG